MEAEGTVGAVEVDTLMIQYVKNDAHENITQLFMMIMMYDSTTLDL